MIPKSVSAVFFSPTGTTAKTVLAIAGGTEIPFEKTDLTLPESRRAFKRQFGEHDMIIAGLPVYAGRLPMYLDDFFTGLNGRSTPAIAVVVYGNREYNDALLELKMKLEERGFIVKSAAAFIGEHTVSPKIAAGRPDEGDLAVASEFGRKSIESIGSNSSGKLLVKGHYPFTWPGFDPRQPPAHPIPRLVTNDSCTQCKVCAQNCPWRAIDPEDSKNRDYFKCMFCYRCLKNCPSQAISVTGDQFLSFLAQFEDMLSRRCEPELFFSE